MSSRQASTIAMRVRVFWFVRPGPPSLVIGHRLLLSFMIPHHYHERALANLARLWYKSDSTLSTREFARTKETVDDASLGRRPNGRRGNPAGTHPDAHPGRWTHHRPSPRAWRDHARSAHRRAAAAPACPTRRRLLRGLRHGTVHRWGHTVRRSRRHARDGPAWRATHVRQSGRPAGRSPEHLHA